MTVESMKFLQPVDKYLFLNGEISFFDKNSENLEGIFYSTFHCVISKRIIRAKIKKFP